MASQQSKTTVAGLDPRFHFLGVFVEYDDGGSTVPGFVRIVLGGGVTLTAAGIVAVGAQAVTYQSAGKIASINSAGGMAEIHVGQAGARYTCLAADAAAQVAALQALITATNVTQSVSTAGRSA